MEPIDMGSSRAKRKAKRRLSNVAVDEISLVKNPAVDDARFVVAKRDEGEPMSEQAQAVVEEVVKDAVDAGAEKPADETPPVDPKAEEPKEVETAAEPEAQDDDAPNPGEEETVEIEKGADAWLKAVKILRGSAGDMDPSGLELTANIMRYVGYRYGEDEAVRTALSKMEFDLDEFDEEKDDIEKAMKVIGPTAFGRIARAAADIIGSAKEIQSLADGAKEIKKEVDGGPTDGGEVEGDGETQEEQPVEKQEEPEEAPADGHGVIDAVEAILAKRSQDADAEAAREIEAGLSRLTARLKDVEQRQSAIAQSLRTATGKA